MRLREATGMPVLECRAAVRHSADHAGRLAYLRDVYSRQMPKGTTWIMPDELRDQHEDG